MFSGLTVCNTFCDLLSSHQLRYVNSIPFGSCFQFFQIELNTFFFLPIFPLEKFGLQALWPLKGWFEFTATGRDAVQVEAGGDENPHRLRKKEKGKVEICWENQKTLPKRA